MRNRITLDDIINGHNFPDGGYWRTIWNDYHRESIRSGYTREESVTRANTLLQITVYGINELLENEPNISTYIIEVAEWLKTHNV